MKRRTFLALAGLAPIAPAVAKIADPIEPPAITPSALQRHRQVISNKHDFEFNRCVCKNCGKTVEQILNNPHVEPCPRK